MWTKAGVALGIFIVLLSSVWYYDQIILRDKHPSLQLINDPDQDGIEIQQINPEHLYLEPIIEPFKPREYIRIYELPLP
ncbi:hypothetical protein CathTA2_2202 [Caldalkalibacillus thermarum TA2.A1]|uniref:Uncharacterized protein n=1 Tax=Caldalkalibacillus thermarum (strain TA2.A1) TaxID=986075 RepID=F5L8P7_CALTT|nr:hypothetical protein [Caldalkalibacillus thermarum]EGL82286.1 hypothetical protein CathTA2_2202 [Caldalkalibacillus thermarum TA2.A1]QZT33421.1 hypothetical protein HUR95_14380 [Caldalkalibacillus thermarum TA2.A1]GGK18170.1 hypothetical protein GCM10010965_09060 [Caldalkalibacillus thermarum]